MSSQAKTDGGRAIAIAKQLLQRAQERQTPAEQHQQAELDRMLGHLPDKATLVEMTDQAFRTRTASRVADQLTHILDMQGVPRFFSPLDRTLLRGFQSFGGYLPGVAVPLVKEKMRRETANVILPAEEEMLVEHLQLRSEQGLRMNVNFLGEALLGEQEAERRMQRYLDALTHSRIECVSVKISTIYSQILPVARQHTVEVIAERLAELYRAALTHRFEGSDGRVSTKFLYLDMEEYRDLHLTTEAMKLALKSPDLDQVRAGIALQAYIPDSSAVLNDLLDWSGERVKRGGVPLTIRVVKGANLEMERIEASLKGWPQAVFLAKHLTDAHYKAMVRSLLDPAHHQSIRVGIASHNLFDIALALWWASENNALDYVQFEMLEGMANHQRRALFEVTGSMLLYAPACHQEEFLHAIGYLIRRLDENTGPDNFLRHAFNLEVDSPEWNRLADDFSASLQDINDVPCRPRRAQDRRTTPQQPTVARSWLEYLNEPDTDWSLPYHSKWIGDVLDDWSVKCDDRAIEIPLKIGDLSFPLQDDTTRASYDPSRPGTVVCRYRQASIAEVNRAIELARRDASGWRNTTLEQRHQQMRRAAQLMRERRGDLIAAATADGGKLVGEGDSEVSEAIDFTEFYPLTVARFAQRSSVSPRGVVAVVSPWNFPVAIPCGGVAAALAAGNSVILKPASQTVLPALLVCQCFWEAGIPTDALQLLPCRGDAGGEALVSDERVEVAILTGGTETAQTMLRARPSLDLMAETGGKNATIVTALSDRDLAIKHVLQSAFGHSGQKCSATSLLLLEQEVYEDPAFRNTLIDAASSIRVGSAWHLENQMGPLISPPSGPLARALNQLEPGESWLLAPQSDPENPQLLRPGIKWDVQPGSFTHCTELFGPVLGVMPFRRLDDAIELVNATGYGLTSGLESLDDREQSWWEQSINAGNLYINRSTTGAIVLRQPFGGMGASAFGAGLKAGGPNYVAALLRFGDPRLGENQDYPQDSELSEPLGELLARYRGPQSERLARRVASIHTAAIQEFLSTYDPVKLLGEDNLRRYLPVPHLRVRLENHDSLLDVLTAAAAAVAVGCRAVFSYDDDLQDDVIEALDGLIRRWSGRIELLHESDSDLAQSVGLGNVDRIRFLSEEEPPEAILLACGDRFIPTIRRRVCDDGFAELLWYVREQSISHEYHRYGNLGRRAGESRRAVL